MKITRNKIFAAIAIVALIVGIITAIVFSSSSSAESSTTGQTTTSQEEADAASRAETDEGYYDPSADEELKARAEAKVEELKTQIGCEYGYEDGSSPAYGIYGGACSYWSYAYDDYTREVNIAVYTTPEARENFLMDFDNTEFDSWDVVSLFEGEDYFLLTTDNKAGEYVSENFPDLTTIR